MRMSDWLRFRNCKFVLGLLLPFFCSSVSTAQSLMTVHVEEHRDVSAPLREMIATAPQQALALDEAEPVRQIPLPPGLVTLLEDPVRQRTAASVTAFAPVASLSFEGLGNGQYGFTVSGEPPDTEGTVGSTQYVQWVNTSFAVFSKTIGALIAGPTAGNTLWSGFGGGCETNNDGDPIVLYDKAAQRWIFSQFSVSTTPFLQCIAVSTTSDATGTYNRYSFQYNNFDDYPKMGVWSDAYYETFNMFGGTGNNTFLGGDVCAYDRAAMLAGAAATQVCFQQGTSVGGLLPSDIDGSTPPPAGSPNYMVDFGNNSLNLFKFHVDFTTPANSTFTGPTVIPVAAFSPLCGGACVPQPGTTQQLDSLADRLMYRLAYRNFGTRESLVVNHSVVAGSGGGVRWYEIQNPSGTPTIAQQSTFAPDSSYRWMGSIAMDRVGDMALGYSVSNGSSVFPSIALTGRVATDPASTMEAEVAVVSGGGSQVGNDSHGMPLTRWGDYSAMQIDPVDDCTFWYTQEYIKTNGVFNWNTRIASFSFPNCTATATFPLTVTAAGTGSGKVTSTPAGISCPGTCSANFASAAVVTLAASAAAGSTFAGWSGACTGTASCAVTMSAARSVTATFNATVNFALTVTLAGTGSGTVTSTPTGISCPGTCSANFGSGASVTLSASPAANSTFTGWNGGGCTGTGNCTVTMSMAQTVTATFVMSFALSVTMAGNGSGTVTSMPTGISCPGTCSASFASGTSVTLSASAVPGSLFTGWSGGGGCTGTGNCTVTMSMAQSVTGTFNLKTTTTTALTVSTPQANAGTTVTFTARVSPTSGSATPTGTVAFSNGSALGSASLSSGSATFTTSSLATGTYSVTAAYGGDANFATSSSAAGALTVVDFTITPGQSSLTVARGQMVQQNLTITPAPLANFDPTVTFACSGLPTESTCTFSPSSVTPNGAAATTTVSIHTMAPTAMLEWGSGSAGLFYAVFLPGFMGIVFLHRNKKKRLAGSARVLGLVCILTLSTAWWTACGSSSRSGGGSTSNPGTPVGSSTVTITATSSGTSPITKQVTITLTVQ